MVVCIVVRLFATYVVNDQRALMHDFPSDVIKAE